MLCLHDRFGNGTVHSGLLNIFFVLCHSFIHVELYFACVYFIRLLTFDFVNNIISFYFLSSSVYASSGVLLHSFSSLSVYVKTFPPKDSFYYSFDWHSSTCKTILSLPLCFFFRGLILFLQMHCSSIIFACPFFFNYVHNFLFSSSLSSNMLVVSQS